MPHTPMPDMSARPAPAWRRPAARVAATLSLLTAVWAAAPIQAASASDELPCRVYDRPDVGTTPPYVYDLHVEVGCFQDDGK